MLLIDGDILAYKVSSACEEAVHWGNDLWTLYADAKEGRNQVDLWIAELQTNLEDERGLRVFLSSKDNYRLDVYSEYKANRKGKRKPMILGELRRHMKDAWNATVIPTLEADDVIGMEASSDPEHIIVSIDKDFKSVPCKLYNPDKPELGIVSISEQEADYWFMYQTLVGDPTDNYGGCKGIGPKKAEKILEGKQTMFDMWQAVIHAYDSAGLSSKHALVQARVARILRSGEYTDGKVKLWSPPKEPK